MQRPTECHRYYYTDQQSFEQSLDVYKPEKQYQQSSAEENLPLVVLVVGSAWLGHRSIIYAGTSWWNSSGPKAFAGQGCVTVCIRHRGSFPRVVPDGNQHFQYSIVPPLVLTAPILAVILLGVPDFHQWDAVLLASIAALVFTSVWYLLALGARGSVEFDGMLQDVADALDWVHRHKDTEILTLSGSSDKNDALKPASKAQTLVFGGYSSGGHVAATLLQRPDVFQSRGLPVPEEFCDAALFISGVLAVRPPVPSNNTIQRRWLTDLVTHVVFGKTGATRLPSPLHGIKKHHPRIPHVLIGCRNEVFGLNWMDIFFCSYAFCESLKATGVSARLIQVESDHWNILGSQAMSRVLKKELRWIMSNRQQ